MNKETLLLALINILIFYFLWFWGYRQYFTHSFRHELFSLRDKLFAFAAEGNISFKNKAFLKRWQEINSMIRHANDTHIFLFTSLALTYKNRKMVEEYNEILNREYSNLQENQRSFLESIRKEQMKLFLYYLIKSSFVLLFLGFASIIYIIIREKIINRKKIKQKIANEFEPYFEAYNEIATNTA